MTKKRVQPTDLQLYRNLGIEPTEKKFIVVVSHVNNDAAQEPIAEEVIELDTPGLTSPQAGWLRLQMDKAADPPP